MSWRGGIYILGGGIIYIMGMAGYSMSWRGDNLCLGRKYVLSHSVNVLGG